MNPPAVEPGYTAVARFAALGLGAAPAPGLGVLSLDANDAKP